MNRKNFISAFLAGFASLFMPTSVPTKEVPVLGGKPDPNFAPTHVSHFLDRFNEVWGIKSDYFVDDNRGKPSHLCIVYKCPDHWNARKKQEIQRRLQSELVKHGFACRKIICDREGMLLDAF